MEKREWNEDTIGRVFGILYETLYSIALYREIRLQERESDVFDPIIRRFWINISNNAIQMAAINWCKVFGAKRNNEMHYSHFVETNCFTGKMQGIDFNEIIDRMKNFRDKYAAHEDPIEERKAIPDFDIAMRVMEAFVETVQEEYDIPPLPPIEVTYEAYRLQVQDCLRQCKIDWDIPEEED